MINQQALAAQNLVVPLAVVTFSVLPQTIHTLWIKYEFGIGGRKPVKDFTPTERGKVNYNYHQQNVVWDVITALVWRGWLSDIACDRIYKVYGCQQSVTIIINNMRKDQRSCSSSLADCKSIYNALLSFYSLRRTLL